MNYQYEQDLSPFSTTLGSNDGLCGVLVSHWLAIGQDIIVLVMSLVVYLHWGSIIHWWWWTRGARWCTRSPPTESQLRWLTGLAPTATSHLGHVISPARSSQATWCSTLTFISLIISLSILGSKNSKEKEFSSGVRWVVPTKPFENTYKLCAFNSSI